MSNDFNTPQNQPQANPFAPPSTGATMGPAPGMAGGGSIEVARPLYEAKGWIKLIGIVNIVLGVLYCITIIYAIVGWIPLWIGICLNSAAGRLEEGFATGNAGAVQEAMSKLKTAFTIMGVLTLVWLIVLVLAIIFVIGMVALGGAAAMNS